MQNRATLVQRCHLASPAGNIAKMNQAPVVVARGITQAALTFLLLPTMSKEDLYESITNLPSGHIKQTTEAILCIGVSKTIYVYIYIYIHIYIYISTAPFLPVDSRNQESADFKNVEEERRCCKACAKRGAYECGLVYMRMKMAHADSASMTKCSEVKSRAKIITDVADRRAKIESGRRILKRIRVRADKVAKCA